MALRRYYVDIHRITVAPPPPPPPPPDPPLPFAPTNVAGVAGDTAITVTWDAPSNADGAVVNDYFVQAFNSTGGPPSGVTGSTARLVGSTDTFLLFDGLTNGTSYTFKVVAINANGNGPASTASTAVAPGTVPNVPTGVDGIAGDAQVGVGWVAPPDPPGAPITQYVVAVYSSSGGTPTGVTGATLRVTGSILSSFVFDGLTNGTGYRFRVGAQNTFGTSALSALSPTITPGSVPDAPTAVGGVAGDTQVGVGWAPPPSPPGAPITGYRVNVYNSTGGTATGVTGGTTRLTGSTATSYLFTGLTDGTGYTFKVAAINTFGTSALSALSPVITPVVPVTPPIPLAPTGVGGIPGSGQVGLGWVAPPPPPGAPVTDYSVKVYNSTGGTATGVTGATTRLVGSATASFVFTGLTNGTGYRFRVAAINANGTSALSSMSVTITPGAGTPPPPRNPRLSDFLVGPLAGMTLGDHYDDAPVLNAIWDSTAFRNACAAFTAPNKMQLEWPGVLRVRDSMLWQSMRNVNHIGEQGVTEYGPYKYVFNPDDPGWTVDDLVRFNDHRARNFPGIWINKCTNVAMAKGFTVRGNNQEDVRMVDETEGNHGIWHLGSKDIEFHGTIIEVRADAYFTQRHYANSTQTITWSDGLTISGATFRKNGRHIFGPNEIDNFTMQNCDISGRGSIYHIETSIHPFGTGTAAIAAYRAMHNHVIADNTIHNLGRDCFTSYGGYGMSGLYILRNHFLDRECSMALGLGSEADSEWGHNDPFGNRLMNGVYVIDNVWEEQPQGYFWRFYYCQHVIATGNVGPTRHIKPVFPNYDTVDLRGAIDYDVTAAKNPGIFRP